MLSAAQFVQWCENLQLTEQTIQQIAQIRNSPPSRRVQSRAGNVSGRYPSRKMGFTIQFESHRNELAAIYEMEYDSSVLEYYDQPPPFKLVYEAKNGRNVGVLHTPDFFVIRSQTCGWEEWKTAEELERLGTQMPNRYQKQPDGNWRCPPGEAHAEKFGLYYRVRSGAEINWNLQRNLLFLEDYFHTESYPQDQETAEKITALISAIPGITLAELLNQEIKADEIYALIAQEKVYVNLQIAPLASQPERVQIFPDILTSKSFLAEVENSKIIPSEELPQTKTSPSTNNHLNNILKSASEKDCQEANRRYQIIAPYLRGAPPSFELVPKRTFYRWVNEWRKAENLYGSGYIGLLPKSHLRGNRHQKLPSTTLNLLEEFIANDYETLKQKGKLASYCTFQKACSEQGILAPSYKTFQKAIKMRPQYEQMSKRLGHRAAYKHETFYWELELTTPRHGDRPFEICHIDHTELDIELISARTSVNLGRPWATFLTDAYSRRILAIYLTFDPPSYRSCMMVMRECVRRHSRLPHSVVVDGAKEFMSIYFERLLAAYECTKKTRPAAKPRFGSVCERLFGTANTMFIHNLQGNTQITRHHRQVTKAVHPRQQAVWTLGSLYQNLCDWAYEFYDNKEHPALGQSPRMAYESGLEQTGNRPQKLIPYDENFRILTLPTTSKGTAKVIPNQGIKINHIYYWHNSFRSRTVEKTQVPVRYDPNDAGCAYAYVKGQWLSCISQHYSSFHGRSEREMMAISEELRKQHKNHSRQFNVNAKALAEFLANAEATEAVLLQRLRDTEAKDVLSTIESSVKNQTQSTSSIPTELTNLAPLKPETDFGAAEVGFVEEEIQPYEEFW